MVAAVDAPEAQKEKHEQPQAEQGPSAKHVRREEAILFQGDEAARLPVQYHTLGRAIHLLYRLAAAIHVFLAASTS